MHLSVVIPVAPAQEAALKLTLESVLALEPFAAEPAERCTLDVIVCHNPLPSGTPGGLPELLGRFDGQVRAVQPPAPLDDLALWNFAVRASAGDWFAMVTPQTTLRPGFARALAESAHRSPEASVLRAGWTRARSNGAAEQHTLLSVRTVTHPAEALYEQRFGPKASTAAAAMRRETWDRMGGFPTETTLVGDWLGDWALWLAAGALGDTVRNPEIIADIRVVPPAHNKAEEMREMFAIYRDVLPRATASAGLGIPMWIAAASRKRLRDVTIAASNEMRPGPTTERASLAEALLPWARSVDQLPLLKRFEAGEKIRSFTLGRKMRPALRRVVAAVR